MKPVLGSIASYDGGDYAGLRYQNLGSNSVELKVEEEESADSETGHTTEAVSFLALEGTGKLKAIASV